MYAMPLFALASAPLLVHAACFEEGCFGKLPIPYHARLRETETIGFFRDIDQYKHMAIKDAELGETETIGFFRDIDQYKHMAIKDAELGETETIGIFRDADQYQHMALKDAELGETETIGIFRDADQYQHMAIKDAELDEAKPAGTDPVLEDTVDTSVWMHADLPADYEPLRGKFIFFNTAEELEQHWLTHQQPGRIGLVTNRSAFARHVRLLSAIEIRWHDVLMLCHVIGDIACHLPLNTQRFFQTEAQFMDDGHVETLVFAQHKMNPYCDPDCMYMHHLVDHILLREGYEHKLTIV